MTAREIALAFNLNEKVVQYTLLRLIKNEYINRKLLIDGHTYVYWVAEIEEVKDEREQ